MLNKKGDQIALENAIFYILNLIFFLALLFFVARNSTGASVHEEILAKKIALMIDEARPGTSMSIDMSKELEIAEKNNVKEPVKIEDNKVFVNLGLGYSFNYFSEHKVYSSVNWKDEKINIEVKDG